MVASEPVQQTRRATTGEPGSDEVGGTMAAFDKKELSERDICSKFITPAVVTAGWDLRDQLREEVPFTKGRVIVRGKTIRRGESKRADYLLYYRPNLPIAVVEAKDNRHKLGDGMQQALDYAESLDVPFVFSSNGDGFLFHDKTVTEQVERELSLSEFPSPDKLWTQYCAWKGIDDPEIQRVVTQDYHTDASGKEPRYYQRNAINRTIEAIAKGQDRCLLVMATGTGKTYTARLIAHDPPTDLAVIKIDPDQALSIIAIGTSSDLMTGEEVIAIGNAYGYEHTVTRGIISSLHRTVEVGEGQQYPDLIQTDASINPGNSGGPLLNIDGDMIGINVAVRVGAQGIGFAVPIDRAMDVAARLVDAEVRKTAAHGIIGQTIATPKQSKFLVSKVATGSAAEQAGLLPGDVITRIDSVAVIRALDFERALIGKPSGEEVEIAAHRNGAQVQMKLVLSQPPTTDNSVSELAWDLLGMRLAPMPDSAFRRLHSRYRGGLKVTGVRPDSPASRQGIRYGDVLVGMHKWETVSLDNVAYVLESDVLSQNDAVKFYVIRGRETLFGRLQVSMRDR